MTRGAEPRFADTAYAQWIRRRLEELGWQKQDLAAAIRKESGGRLGESGADAAVRRATHGENINAANRALIAQILGPSEPPPVVREEDLLGRLAAVEAAIETGSSEVADSLDRLEAAIAKLSAQIQHVDELGRKSG